MSRKISADKRVTRVVALLNSLCLASMTSMNSVLAHSPHGAPTPLVPTLPHTSTQGGASGNPAGFVPMPISMLKTITNTWVPTQTAPVHNAQAFHPSLATSQTLSVANTHGIHNTLVSARPSIQSPSAAQEVVQLDLTSSLKSIVLDAGAIKNGSQITITMGGTVKTFHTGDKVTAGELVAIEQAQTAGQSIVLDRRGVADGGTLSLNMITSSQNAIHVSAISISKNVTALDDASSKSTVSLSGDLVNYGSIVEVSKGGIRGSSDISALDITNEKGGLISSVDSSAANNTTDLSLHAQGDLTNMGTIQSSGNLTLSAGGTLSNIPALVGHGTSVTAPTIHAAQDVNLISSNIVNAGTISSTGGNVNIKTYSPASVNVNNAGGVIAAQSGNINVRDSRESRSKCRPNDRCRLSQRKYSKNQRHHPGSVYKGFGHDRRPDNHQ
jgi:hypothetical protein